MTIREKIADWLDGIAGHADRKSAEAENILAFYRWMRFIEANKHRPMFQTAIEYYGDAGEWSCDLVTGVPYGAVEEVKRTFNGAIDAALNRAEEIYRKEQD
jgi:hypothetical protein